ESFISLKRFQMLNTKTDPVNWTHTWSTFKFTLFAARSQTNFKENSFMRFRTKLLFNELPTIDKLQQRRPDLYPVKLLCSLCHMELETNEHVWFCSAPSSSTHQDTFKKIILLARGSLVIKLTNLWQKGDRNKQFPYK